MRNKRKETNCLIPFISETFLLYPKQGMRKRNNFPFISETSGKVKNTLLQFKKHDDIVATTVWRMLK